MERLMQPASLSTLLHGHKQHLAQHLASTGLDFMCMCRSCSHYLMWSQCEPSQSWNAASVQEGLTWIDGKNGTQIIKRGHPHVTKKVMHIKITHLFELYISARAVNRSLQTQGGFPRAFTDFSKGLNLPPHSASCTMFLHPPWLISPCYMFINLEDQRAPGGAFSQSKNWASFSGEIMSPHSEISCNITGKLRFDIIPPSPVKPHQHIEGISKS